MVYVKSSVQPKGYTIFAAVANACGELGINTTLTSANDSKHMKGSLHYTGNALDFRTKHLPKDVKRKLISVTKRRLANKAYQFVLEDEGKANEHLHIEYDLR